VKKQHPLDKIASLKMPSPDDPPMVPGPEIVGFIVNWCRSLRQWKVETLASFARVSVATIERVERGERVSPESIDKIGTAFGYEPGYLTSPRTAISQEEALQKLDESVGHVELVPVSRMCSQRKIREAAGCHNYLPYRVGTTPVVDEEINGLVEWIDLIAFVLSTPSSNDDECRRRYLYKGALDCIDRIEKQGFTVLSGVMAVPMVEIAEWKVSIIAISPRSTDPGALKRKHVLVDRRCVTRAPTKFAWEIWDD